MEKKRILFLLSFAFFFVAKAQEFGGNPPSIRWKQINSDTARIIFPSGLESQAADIANVVHRLAAQTRPTIGNVTRKINIVLQPLPTVANGYVSLGPFRSEFFLTPRQNSFELGSLPWHKTLAMHEYRHVQQYSNFRKGISKAFYLVFGEEGQALANSLTIPDWFYEGDAVYQETFVSDQGRGRLPYFFNDYKSLWSSGKNYSWMKLRNGSYKDLVPDHYQLGYMLTAYGYEKYGNAFWKNVTGDAAAFKGLFYPFQHAVKKYSGKSYPTFRRQALNFFEEESNTKTNDSVSSFGKQAKHFVSDEMYPQWKDHDTLIYIKSDYKRIPYFALRNVTTGKEQPIKLRSIANDTYFSYKNGRIVYSAYEPDIRWRWRNYEVIKVLDINTRKERKITGKTRYLSPDISDDGSKIVAVDAKIAGPNNLVVIDAPTGRVTDSIPNTNNYVFTYPKFFNNDTVVAAVRNKIGEMALGLFNIKTGEAKWLSPFTLNVIAFPQVYKDTIAFGMTEGSADKLFIYANGKVSRFNPGIRNLTTGNYQLSLQNGRYAWSTFTAAGYQVMSSSGSFTDIAQENNGENNFYPLARLKQPFNVINDTSIHNFEVEKYSSSFQLFKFHSWRPYFSDPDYSYSLISQNILNTLQSEIYFNYNRNEKFKETGAGLSYGGWFPVISAGAAFTFDRSFADSSRIINWNELNASAGVSIPLSFAGGTFFQSVNFSGSFNTKQVYYTGASKGSFNDKRFNYAEWSIFGSNQQAKAKQNIFPRFAQTFLARYRHIINNYSAHQLLVSGSIYVPGFARNHNIVVQAAYQLRDTLQQYTFTNSFPFSRGYSDIDFPRMWKIGGNYHFPIAYPDVGFANIVYLLRLRGNVFYDYSQIKSLRFNRTLPFKTAGAEIYFDTKWWNQLPLSFGFRYNRLLDSDVLGIGANKFEIVLPMNLLSR